MTRPGAEARATGYSRTRTLRKRAQGIGWTLATIASLGACAYFLFTW